MTTLRPMTNADLLAYQRLCSICYTYAAKEPPKELPEELLRIRMGVFADDGSLLSAMMQIPYTVRFAERDVKLAGIGGVVTDPTARGERGVRRLFEEGLPRLYREGHVLSALYPFSHAFYRKFGYEWAEFGRNVGFPRASIRASLVRAEEILRVLPDGDDQGMRGIYQTYAADKHLALVRTEDMWRDLRRGTPWDDLKYAYVLKCGGKPAAYWIGAMRKEGWKCTLTIHDMAWTSRTGRDAIFAMLRGMNEVEDVHLRAYEGFDPREIVSEPYDVSGPGSCDGMLRVVNAERALALLPAPVLPGSITLSVQDDQIPGNCGCFTVRSDGEHLTVIRDDQTAPDATVSIHGLSALMSGRWSFTRAANEGAVVCLNEEKLRFADLLFPRHELHMNHDF